MGESPCEQFFCINKYISTIFVMESLSVPCFYPSIAFVFVLYFLHLPVSLVGCSFFKNLGMARGARLLVTVGRGGVRSVGVRTKLRRTIKGKGMRFRSGTKLFTM